MDKGEVHIKYGCVAGDAGYLIKIASGFPGNPALGMPASNGLMLVFSQRSGEPQCILLDEGYLTDRRTAAAGAVAAKYLAPARVERIGILGTGIQARMQLLELSSVISCREVAVWGRNPQHVELYCEEMQAKGYQVSATADIEEIPASCNLIITTTPATEPILPAENHSSRDTYHRHRVRHPAQAGNSTANYWRGLDSSSPTASSNASFEVKYSKRLAPPSSSARTSSR